MKNYTCGLNGSMVALIAMCGFCEQVSADSLSFDPATSYAASIRPSGVTLADFNGDGHIDIATTADNPDRVIILLNNGSGQFTPGQLFFLPSSASPQDIIAGDLNNNGHIDLAVAVRDPQGAVMILYNNGSAQFTAGPTVLVGTRPRGLTIGDMNGDGWLDLGVVNRDADSASVITNNAGTFSVQTFSTTGEPRDATFGDFNGNGLLDLAVSDRDNRVIRVFDNVNGTFIAGAVLFVGGNVRPDGVIAADFTGNGHIDIATATSSSSPTISQVSIFTNSGSAFTGPFNYPTNGEDASHLVAADFDCDGHLDIAVTNSDSNNVSVLRNAGNGTFGPPLVLAAGTRPGRIDAADVSGNGGPDIAVANRDSDNITVSLNTSKGCDDVDPCPIVGDLNCDGVVDGADLLILLSQWGTCKDPGDCPADLNEDGTVDGADLLILLANWG